MKRILVLIFVSLIFVFSCKKDEKSILQKRIEDLNSQIISDTINLEIDQKIAVAYINVLDSFIKLYPEDEKCAHYLFQVGDVYRGMNQYYKSIKAFEKIEKEFPKDSLAEMSLFIQGFMAENNLNNTSLAHLKYSLFLEKYPNSNLVETVKFSLENLGKSNEEILKQILEKNSKE